MKKLITKDVIKNVIEQYSKYKLSLSERGVIDSISSEIADELRRRFVIEPYYNKQTKPKTATK
jgi:hypothetical protein